MCICRKSSYIEKNLTKTFVDKKGNAKVNAEEKWDRGYMKKDAVPMLKCPCFDEIAHPVVPVVAKLQR